MKKYKLIRSVIFASITSLVLITTGCNTNRKDNLKDKYVAVIDGEVKLLEEEKTIGGKLFGYIDIITKERYNNNSSSFEDINIKGSLANYLSSEEISVIKDINLFGDDFKNEDLITIKTSLSNKYRQEWRLNTNNELSNKDKEIFIDEYDNLIPNDKLYILDTSLCKVENEYGYGVDKYYLIMENDTPIK